MKLSKNIHLSKEDIIKNGSIYTPKNIVKIVYNMIKPFIKEDSIIIDFGSGYGSFIDVFSKLNNICIGTEIDQNSYNFLIKNFPNNKFYLENSLVKVSRRKYKITKSNHLIVIGNPPYNDVTSQYKKGNKGKLICDDDLISRDMGISFLKAYNKLLANYICILHPLSYLIKKQNFNMLKEFNKNYKLLDGIIFSSQEFESIQKGNFEFPVVAALYEKNESGMDFQYINNFNFKILNCKKTFNLQSIKTIDGIVSKYPQKNNKTQLQFYTQRDMNSLLRNTGFFIGPKNNGLNITINNLYQYSWLYFLKNNFNPKKNKFMYGNLSPFYFDELETKKYQNLVISYAYNNCSLIKDYFNKKEIEKKYGKITNNYQDLFNLLKKIYIFE